MRSNEHDILDLLIPSAFRHCVYFYQNSFDDKRTCVIEIVYIQIVDAERDHRSISLQRRIQIKFWFFPHTHPMAHCSMSTEHSINETIMSEQFSKEIELKFLRFALSAAHTHTHVVCDERNFQLTQQTEFFFLVSLELAASVEIDDHDYADCKWIALASSEFSIFCETKCFDVIISEMQIGRCDASIDASITIQYSMGWALGIFLFIFGQITICSPSACVQVHIDTLLHRNHPFPADRIESLDSVRLNCKVNICMHVAAMMMIFCK